MKFYITEETRQELEIKLVKIDFDIQAQKSFKFPVEYILGELEGEKRTIQQLLSSATVLPVEESWEDFDKATNAMYKHFKSTGVEYPNGVIIEPK